MPQGSRAVRPTNGLYLFTFSVVNIPTRYGLHRPWIGLRWKRDFPHPSRMTPWSNQPPVQLVQDNSRRIKRPRRDVNHPPLSRAEVKEKVEIHLYSPSAPSWQFVRWTSILPGYFTCRWYQATCQKCLSVKCPY